MAKAGYDPLLLLTEEMCSVQTVQEVSGESGF